MTSVAACSVDCARKRVRRIAWCCQKILRWRSTAAKAWSFRANNWSRARNPRSTSNDSGRNYFFLLLLSTARRVECAGDGSSEESSALRAVADYDAAGDRGTLPDVVRAVHCRCPDRVVCGRNHGVVPFRDHACEYRAGFARGTVQQTVAGGVDRSVFAGSFVAVGVLTEE